MNGSSDDIGPLRLDPVNITRVVKARWLYAERTRRAGIFSDLSDAQMEPSWDMLLDLFIHEKEGRPSAVTSMVMGGRTPYTTGLRWVELLRKRGWVDSYALPSDRRLRMMHLTPKAVTALTQYLDGMTFPDDPTLGNQAPD